LAIGIFSAAFSPYSQRIDSRSESVSREVLHPVVLGRGSNYNLAKSGNGGNKGEGEVHIEGGRSGLK
jgi:hypothetical protein